MRLKICGITQVQQAINIVNLGVDTLGFICVKQTPRYVEAEQIKNIIQKLPQQISKVGVFVNEEIKQIIFQLPIQSYKYTWTNKTFVTQKGTPVCSPKWSS